jgi:hypothetical protein
LLPAGAVAGWDLHPLESAAFARRTPDADIYWRSETVRHDIIIKPKALSLLDRGGFDTGSIAVARNQRIS